MIVNAGVLMASRRGALIDAEALSVTLMVKFDEPAVLGVPDIVFPERLSPAGRDPLATDQV